jgi:hypothetical protein
VLTKGSEEPVLDCATDAVIGRATDFILFKNAFGGDIVVVVGSCETILISWGGTMLGEAVDLGVTFKSLDLTLDGLAINAVGLVSPIHSLRVQERNGDKLGGARPGISSWSLLLAVALAWGNFLIRLT